MASEKSRTKACYTFATKKHPGGIGKGVEVRGDHTVLILPELDRHPKSLLRKQRGVGYQRLIFTRDALNIE